jgi:hypothetical protein
VKGMRCVGAGIGTHEVIAGHITAGELWRQLEKLVPGVVNYFFPRTCRECRAD